MITIIKYETEEEAEQIIAEKVALGLILVEVSNIKEGNFLGFSDNPLPDKTPIEQQLDGVKAENAVLQQRLAQTNGDFTAFTDFYFEQNPTQA
jgi:hypothetical protein